MTAVEPPPEAAETGALPPEPFRARVRRFLDTPGVEVALMLLIVVSSTLAVIEIDRTLSPRQSFWVVLVGDMITFVFIVELSLRAWSSQRRRFLQRHWIDIVSCVPFGPWWPASWGAIRVLRLFRLLRILRFGALVRRRYVQGSGGELPLLVSLVAFVLVLGAALMFAFESSDDPAFRSLGHSFWWSVFSLVSGEAASGLPQTTAGRGVALLLALSGLCIFAVITGAAAAVMSQRLKRVEVYAMGLEELEGHTILCGWDRRAPLIIEELQHSEEERQRPIVVVAELEALPELNWKIVQRDRVYLVPGDFTKAENLEKAGIRRAAKAIIVSDKSGHRTDQDRDARTILAALTIEKLNSKIYTCAELLNREHEAHLRMAGVEDVVSASEYGATLISSMAIHSGISGIIAELLSVQVGNEFYKLDVPPAMEGKRFSEIVASIVSRHGAIAIAVERGSGGRKREMMLNPEPGFVVQKGDRLVVISRTRPDLGSA